MFNIYINVLIKQNCFKIFICKFDKQGIFRGFNAGSKLLNVRLSKKHYVWFLGLDFFLFVRDVVVVGWEPTSFNENTCSLQ